MGQIQCQIHQRLNPSEAKGTKVLKVHAGIAKEEPNRPQISSEVDRGAPFVRSFQEFKDLQLGCGEQYVKKVGLGLVCMDGFDAGTSWMQFPFGHLSTFALLLILLIKSSHLRGIWFLWQFSGECRGMECTTPGMRSQGGEKPPWPPSGGHGVQGSSPRGVEAGPDHIWSSSKTSDNMGIWHASNASFFSSVRPLFLEPTPNYPASDCAGPRQGLQFCPGSPALNALARSEGLEPLGVGSWGSCKISACRGVIINKKMWWLFMVHFFTSWMVEHFMKLPGLRWDFCWATRHALPRATTRAIAVRGATSWWSSCDAGSCLCSSSLLVVTFSNQRLIETWWFWGDMSLSIYIYNYIQSYTARLCICTSVYIYI